jgi:acetyl-CoA C-acetyltransferase
MTQAVIVSTARTPIGKAYRGALNNTEGPTMAGHVIGEAVRRAKVAPGESRTLSWAVPCSRAQR